MAADLSYPNGFQVRQDGNAVVPTGKSLDIESGGELRIAGTAITATAAEINAIAGGGLSAAELGYLDGVTAGTVLASKAVVAGTDKNVDVLAVADLKLGAGAGTSVTATAVELNQYSLCLDIADGSAEATYFLVCPHAGDIAKIYTVIDDVVSTADITITAKIGATGVTNGVVTIATASSAAGDVDVATPTAANTVTAGQAINLVVTGGGAGGAPRIHVVVVITR
jgi:hypothetical protein